MGTMPEVTRGEEEVGFSKKKYQENSGFETKKLFSIILIITSNFFIFHPHWGGLNEHQEYHYSYQRRRRLYRFSRLLLDATSTSRNIRFV